MYVFVCLPRFCIGFLFAKVHKLTRTHTRARICNAHNYSAAEHVKTKVVVVVAVVVGEGSSVR